MTARDKVSLMKLPAPPRSNLEVKFFVDESPCERCGTRGYKQRWPRYDAGRYEATCAGCGLNREFTFEPPPNGEWPPVFHLGFGDEPSKVFTPEELRASADRELALVPLEPAELRTLEQFRVARHRLERARTALVELGKFRHEDTALASELEQVVALHGVYKEAEAVVDAKVGAHAKPIGLDGRFIAHRKWIGRKRVGDGQLVFRGENWSGFSLSTRLWSWAVIEDTKFERMEMSYGEFVETEMRRAKFLKCNVQMSKFERVTFEHCDLSGSQLSLTRLIAVVALQGDWTRLIGGRSRWQGRFEAVDFQESQLRDSVFDESTFERCDLRTVDLRRQDPTLTALGYARNTRFVDCDLRGMEIEGWRLNGVVFERCRMHGMVGTPVVEGDVTIEACDFSEGGEAGPDELASVRLLASWRQSEKR